MRFVVDEPLPPALARWLRERGQEAEHVKELDLLATDDRLICEYAARVAAIIVTKDEDYETLLDKTMGLRVVWVQVGNAVNRVLLARMEQVWDDVVQCLENGDTLVNVFEDEPTSGLRLSRAGDEGSFG